MSGLQDTQKLTCHSYSISLYMSEDITYIIMIVVVVVVMMMMIMLGKG
jgi:hypothetical protein